MRLETKFSVNPERVWCRDAEARKEHRNDQHSSGSCLPKAEGSEAPVARLMVSLDLLQRLGSRSTFWGALESLYKVSADYLLEVSVQVETVF